MSFARASLFTATSTLIKILVGLIVGKLIAVQFGPEGVGLAGNYRQLITVLGVLAGAGIFNGITKYIAEYEQANRLDEQHRLLGTASTFVLGFSITIGLSFLFFSQQISLLLFSDSKFAQVIQILAVLQFVIAYSNLLLAILKGYRDALANAFSIIIGTVLALIGFYILQLVWGYHGALVGLALLPAFSLFPAIYFVNRKRTINWQALRPSWNNNIAYKLSKFTVMTLITAVTIPVAYYLLREQLLKHYGWREVGIWQGVSTISDAYLQFITAAFSVYLLPTFSRIKEPLALSKSVIKHLLMILPLVFVVSFCVWLVRDWVIWLLFSEEFNAMNPLFIWQLGGDILKVGCYVFGYLIISQASLRLYLLAEVSQFSLLVGFSHWLIPNKGAIGATQSYLFTYSIYFLICVMGFMLFKRYASQKAAS